MQQKPQINSDKRCLERESWGVVLWLGSFKSCHQSLWPLIEDAEGWGVHMSPFQGSQYPETLLSPRPRYPLNYDNHSSMWHLRLTEPSWITAMINSATRRKIRNYSNGSPRKLYMCISSIPNFVSSCGCPSCWIHFPKALIVRCTPPSYLTGCLGIRIVG